MTEQTIQVQDKVQIVNENKEFNQNVGGVIMNQWQLGDDIGLNYNVVAVFGSQSTGKSTLLNKLFGTHFDVMSEKRRQQTTRGIWLSKASGSDVGASQDGQIDALSSSEQRNILVLDVEGTDGRERGEDQEFERRSALFSLAVAEVIIVNLWENMVGLYNGANIGLLKTVFEVNLQLLQRSDSPKTCLLFVIRDFLGTTPLEDLKQVMMESLDKIWSELNATQKYSQTTNKTQLSDYFDFDFVALPHKVLQPEAFDVGVNQLQSRFFSSSKQQQVQLKESPVFKPEYARGIPIDGYSHYMNSVWEQIVGSKDLDLPTQQQLLAQYRCDEIMNVEYERFLQQIKQKQLDVNSGKVLDKFSELSDVRDSTIQQFDKSASRYHIEVYQKKKQELAVKLNGALNLLFIAQIKNLHKVCIAEFKSDVGKILKGDSEHFAQGLMQAQDKIKAKFSEKASEAVLSGTDWTVAEDEKQFNDEIVEQSSKIRHEEMEKWGKRLIKQVGNQITDGLVDQFADSETDFWPSMNFLLESQVEKACRQFTSKVQPFQASEEEIVEYIDWIRQDCWDNYRAKLKEELSDQMLLSRLKSKFEQHFRYDENGLPRVWQQNENIEPYFLAARDKTELMITRLAKMPLPEQYGSAEYILNDPDFDEDVQCMTMLSTSRQRDIKERFVKDAQMIYLEIKRGALTSFSEIPKGVWLLLLVLGFNELYATLQFILSSPLLVVLLVLVFSSIVVLYQSGLLMPVTKAAMRSARPLMSIGFQSIGPMVENGRLLLAESLRNISSKLDEQNATSGQSGSNGSTINNRPSLGHSSSFTRPLSDIPLSSAASSVTTTPVKQRPQSQGVFGQMDKGSNSPPEQFYTPMKKGN
ncbi:hypothetical protein MP228_005399 [Amoeboaphelidium protococcarum]|nr:hypothetical protein MP228_005399 [Amoeboaphelidium protococcarum]